MNGTSTAILILSPRFRRIKRDGKLPDTIFIQIDGGVENTAKIFLALCELIVAKGLTKKIILSRLPVGMQMQYEFCSVAYYY